MSKITSWDGNLSRYIGDGDRRVVVEEGNEGAACRVVLWPEGAPDPSTVPHAGEKVSWDGCSPHIVKTGIPEKSGGGTWCLRTNEGYSLYAIDRLKRIPDSPTIEVGGKKYRESDVVARCEELEEVF